MGHFHTLETCGRHISETTKPIHLILNSLHSSMPTDVQRPNHMSIPPKMGRLWAKNLSEKPVYKPHAM